MIIFHQIVTQIGSSYKCPHVFLMAQEIYLCRNIWLPINPNQIYDIAYTLMQYDVQPQIGV